jgi:hypothetical protein
MQEVDTAADHTQPRRILLLLLCTVSALRNREADTVKNGIRPKLIIFPQSSIMSGSCRYQM